VSNNRQIRNICLLTNISALIILYTVMNVNIVFNILGSVECWMNQFSDAVIKYRKTVIAVF